MTTRGLLFGGVAAAYERYRADYPPEVADLITAYAAPPLADALEVGAGTGKATRLIAGRGIRVTACEPDPQMAALLRASTAGLEVTVVESTFEDFASEQRFDLLYAASAWHWTDPSSRWGHTAEILRPGGTVAVVGGDQKLADPDLRDAVQQVRRTMISDDDAHARPPSPETGLRWPGTELQDHPQFVDIEQHDIPRLVEIAADDFVGHLSTVSAYLLLPEPERSDLLRRTRAALPARVEIVAGLSLHLARLVATSLDEEG